MPRIRTVLPLALMLCGGCYTFEPVPIEAPSPGASVRAEVDSVGFRTVVSFTGDPSTTVEGSLVRRDSASVVLSVFRNDLPGAVHAGNVEVPLPRAHVVDFALKRLSTPRTAGLLAGLAVGIALITRALWHGAGGGLPNNGPPPTI